MKKRLFNSKKKLLLTIVIMFFVAFLGCSAVVLSIASTTVSKKVYSLSPAPISEEYYLRELYNSKFHTTENFIPQEFEGYDNFPYAVALYDKNGNLVHKSGALISFFDDDLGYGGSRYCYIEEYLSDEDFDRLIEFVDENDRIEIEEFRYYQSEQGEIIPVSMVFENSRQEKGVKTLEIIVNENYSGEVRVQSQADSGPLWLHMYENNTGSSNKKDFFDKAQIKSYREAISLVTSEEYKGEAFESFKNNSGGGWFLTSSNGSITINGELHFFVVCVRYNEFAHIIHEAGYNIGSLFCFFAVLGAISLSVAAKYYDKTKAFEESKNAFISAMTHEMKTPIAIIQNQCECVLENIAPEKNEEYLKSIYDETQKMNKLVTDMLQYNRIAQTDKLTLEKCNLSEIVKEEAERYKKQFELHEKNVTLNIKENSVVKCDRNLIELVVDNMLSNTIKHSGSSGEVIVTVKDNIEGYKVSVYNSGSTISNDEKDKIWSVLYKTDKSRTDRDKSSGVGLAVSAKILDLHKAHYGCVNVNDGVEFYFMIK